MRQRQDLIDTYRRYDEQLPRARANVRRLRRRYITRVVEHQMKRGELPPQFGHAERTAIALAQDECTEIRACLACISECLVGTEELR